MKEDFLYEILVSISIIECPIELTSKLLVVSSNIEGAISKAREFLKDQEKIKEFRILEVKEISEKCYHLIS